MLLFIVLVVPLVAVAVLQTIVLIKLRSDDMAAFRTSIANQRQAQRNRRLLIMSIVIVLAFAVCWLPFLANTFLHLYFSRSIPECSFSYDVFSLFARLFSFCHVMANPCVCFTFMHRLRVFVKPKNKITLRKSTTSLETRLWQSVVSSCPFIDQISLKFQVGKRIEQKFFRSFIPKCLVYLARLA